MTATVDIWEATKTHNTELYTMCSRSLKKKKKEKTALRK